MQVLLKSSLWMVNSSIGLIVLKRLNLTLKVGYIVSDYLRKGEIMVGLPLGL